MGASIAATEKRWTMPNWMEPYRELIGNTGGDSVEHLMNDHHSHLGNNAIRAALIVCVDSQVKLLQRLHLNGLLRSGKMPLRKAQG